MLLNREVQRVGVVALAANVGTGAALKQQFDCLFAVAENRLMQRRSYAFAAPLVNQLRVRIKQRIQSREIAFSSGRPQRRDSRCRRAGRFERFDVRLQLGPGRESIFVRNHQLRIRKCERRRSDLFVRTILPSRMAVANANQGIGVRCLLALQQRLGLFFELIETGTGRKLPGHENLLSGLGLCPQCRQKEDSSNCCWPTDAGGLGPFRGLDAPRAPRSTLIPDSSQSQCSCKEQIAFRRRPPA